MGDVVVTNDDIVGPINSSDEWIRQRTGVIERRRASADVEAVDLAVEAANDAIAAAGIRPDQIGAVLVSTISNTVQTPSLAALLTERIGATPAPAYDISAACAGFTYGIAQADSFIRTGLAEYVLVLGAEKLSTYAKPTDRTISFLLGRRRRCRGARPGRRARRLPHRVGIGRRQVGRRRHGQPAVARTATVPARSTGRPCARRARRSSAGRSGRWRRSPQQALDVAGITADDLAAFIPHQANMRIIDELAKQLKLPAHVEIARDIAHDGQHLRRVDPARGPRLLAEHPELSGGLALQIGFGAGLVFGAQVVRLP